MENIGKRILTALLPVIICAGVSAAAEHSGALRMENRLSWTLNPALTLRGGVQARLRDNLSHFYYRKADAGIIYQYSHRLRLPLTLRVEERSRDFGWLRRTYLLFDPTLLLAEPGGWRFDIRVRLQYLADNNSLHYLRIQPRVWRDFELTGYAMGWWVWNDIYIRLDDVGTGDVTNYRANNFCSGFNLPLGHGSDLNVYYMLYTGRGTMIDERRHAHQACFSLGFHFGGDGDRPLPPTVHN
jgi:hypothetical protein